MKKSTQIVLVVALAIIIAGGGFFVYKATHVPPVVQPTASSPVAKAMYACPMNCVPPVDKPGQRCPKCGMEMVLMK